MKKLTPKRKKVFLKYKKKIEAKRAKITKLYRDIDTLRSELHDK